MSAVSFCPQNHFPIATSNKNTSCSRGPDWLADYFGLPTNHQPHQPYSSELGYIPVQDLVTNEYLNLLKRHSQEEKDLMLYTTYQEKPLFWDNSTRAKIVAYIESGADYRKIHRIFFGKFLFRSIAVLDMSMTRYLLGHGADVHIKHKLSTNSTILEAARSIGMVNLLIDYGALDQPYCASEILLSALNNCFIDTTKVVQFWLDAGANPYSIDTNGCNAFQLAQYNILHKKEIIRLLNQCLHKNIKRAKK